MQAKCVRCGGPTTVVGISLLPVVCSTCTRTVLPAPGTRKVRRSKWWRLFRG